MDTTLDRQRQADRLVGRLTFAAEVLLETLAETGVPEHRQSTIDQVLGILADVAADNPYQRDDIEHVFRLHGRELSAGDGMWHRIYGLVAS